MLPKVQILFVSLQWVIWLKRVPSPASADMGFAVSSASDFGTTNRTNDGISSFTNYGPRLDDGMTMSGMAQTRYLFIWF